MSPQTHLTAEDYRLTPEGPPWLQLIEGELVQEPSPNSSHQLVHADLYRILASQVWEQRLGLVIAAPMDVWLDNENVLQPDLLYVSRRRAGIVADDGVHGPPDLVVEILSPSSGSRDLIQKRRIYARSGVEEYWLVDPRSRQVTVFRFAETGESPIRIAAPGEQLASPLFPGFSIDVGSIFQSADERAARIGSVDSK
jgi:Uma2 family endonuclease